MIPIVRIGALAPDVPVNSEDRVIANVVWSLRQNPELAIFLTLALGFLLGRMKFGTFRLGNVVGTLLAGVLIGQLAIKVHPLVSIVFFDLFLFATGYKVGPQFFRGLKKKAVPQVSLTIVLCVTSRRRQSGERKFSDMTAAPLPACWQAPSRRVRSLARRVTLSPGSICLRPRSDDC